MIKLVTIVFTACLEQWVSFSSVSVVCLLLPQTAYSSEENMDAQTLVNMADVSAADPMSSSYLLQLVIGLLVVLICIVALAWFAKKINRFRLVTDDSLKIIAGLSMGTRERVVLLQVGEKQLLIGVAPGRINALHVLDTPVETTDNRPYIKSAKSFSDKLKTVMAETGKTKQEKND